MYNFLYGEIDCHLISGLLFSAGLLKDVLFRAAIVVLKWLGSKCSQRNLKITEKEWGGKIYSCENSDYKLLQYAHGQFASNMCASVGNLHLTNKSVEPEPCVKPHNGNYMAIYISKRSKTFNTLGVSA